VRTKIGPTDRPVGFRRQRKQTVGLGHTQEQVHLEAETPHCGHQGTSLESIFKWHAGVGRGDPGQEHQSVEHQRWVPPLFHRHRSTGLQPQLFTRWQEFHLYPWLIVKQCYYLGREDNEGGKGLVRPLKQSYLHEYVSQW